jgi:hypothetical protein
MDKDEKSKGSWWHTVPGMLTALTGIIGAITSLILALHQAGLFGVPPQDVPRHEVRELPVPPPLPVPTEQKGIPNVGQRPVSNAAAPTAKRPFPITADNVATKVREGLWNWTVFIQGSNDDLDWVQCVEYTLHPTFSDPIQTVCQKGIASRAFALSGSAWGTFEVRIRLIMTDGGQQQLTHNLRF